MNAVIEDPMGLESGIRIDMVKTVTDRKAGRITIRGRMTACRHNGCFWTNRQALWSIEIEDVDERISWDEISMLHLRLIYCNNQSNGRTDGRVQSGEASLRYSNLTAN